MAQLRARMSRDAGIVRDGARLTGLLAWLVATAEARGRALPLVAARLIVEAALARRESRGGHFRTDFPRPAEAAVHSLTTLAGRARRDAA
jgi:L-aspartate oxidase